jgi:hypothetical protein
MKGHAFSSEHLLRDGMVREVRDQGLGEEEPTSLGFHCCNIESLSS